MRGPALAAAAAVALACAHATPRAPEAPATTAEPHVEPDLVGVVHVVKRGETIHRIARAYGIPPRELMEVNDVRDSRLVQPGTELFVPGATRAREVPPPAPGAPADPEVVVPEPSGEGEKARVAPFRWPVPGGVLYSRYGVRQGQRHDGIDIAAPEGTAIGAAAGGSVVYAGEQSGYGSIVMLRHDGGLLTLYAHASALLVKQGEHVQAGQPIARVGRSGRTSGPHLHFEVRDGTRPRDPLSYLP